MLHMLVFLQDLLRLNLTYLLVQGTPEAAIEED